MKVGARVNLDKVGAFASAACAVHCLLSGVALGLLSVVGLGFIGSVTTDIVFMVVTLSVAGLAIFSGLRKHHSLLPAGIFAVGLLAIVLSHFILKSPGDTRPESPLVTTLSVLGGLCLVTFHVVNLRLGRTCKH